MREALAPTGRHFAGRSLLTVSLLLTAFTIAYLALAATFSI